MDYEDSEESSRRHWMFFFAMCGVLGTATLAGMGGANWWHLTQANGIFTNPHFVSPRGAALYVLAYVMAGFLDLFALAIVFEGGILFVQRLRGRI